MSSTVTRVACLAVLLLVPATALAQPAHDHRVDDHRVTVEDVRVDGQPLPAALQPILSGPLETTIEPIRACYRARTAQRPTLAGTMRLSMWVSNRQVIRVTQEASTLADPQLERCVTDEIRRYRLPDTAPAGGAQVQCTVRFERGVAPVAPAGAPAGAPASPVPTAPDGSPLDLGQVLSGLPPNVLDVPSSLLGGLPGIGQLFGGPSTPAGTAPGTPAGGQPVAVPTPQPTGERVRVDVRSARGALEAPTVTEGLQRQSAPLWACYETARARTSRVGTTVRVDLRIAADGAVRTATASTGLRDRLATECVRRVVRQTPFAPAARTTQASANLRFTPTP